MGYLFQILLALGAQSLVEAGVSTGWRAPWLVLVSCALPHLFARAVERLSLRGRFRAAALGLRALHAGAPLLYCAALSLFGWQSSVEAWTGARISSLDWPRPVLLLVYLPFVVFELLVIDARSRLINPRGAAQRAWRGFQVRMFLSSLLPVVVYVLLSCAAGLSDELRTNIEQVALYGGMYAALLFLVLALCLPFMLRNTWETTPLAHGVQRDLLLAVARRADFEAGALLVWNTGQQMANAAIIGIGARSRVVLFSDLLLAQLDLRELAAVFAHEIGHAARHHVPIFVMWAVAFFMGADLLVHWAFADNLWLAGALIAAMLGLWYVSFGFLSRRFELDADLFSLELIGDHQALIGALERVGGGFRDIASWRHFSTARRVRFLEQVSADPAHGARLRRKLRRAIWIGGGLFVLVFALELRVLWSSFAPDRIGVDLRLGRYAAAAERAQRARDLDPELSALVARARSLGRDEADVSELEARARAALRQREPRTALEWLELGALRGRSDMEDASLSVRTLLDERSEGAADGGTGGALASGAGSASSALEAPPTWKADIAACFE